MAPIAPPEDRAELEPRLRTLLEQVGQRGLAALRDPEVEELALLYRAAATRLAWLQAFGASTRRRSELNDLVARGHALLYGRPQSSGRWLRSLTLGALLVPATLRRTARYSGLAALLLLLGFAYGWLGAARDPEWALAQTWSDDERTPYASREALERTLLHGRDGEVDSGDKALFAAFLWQHNTRIALLAFFAGFLLGLPAALLVFYNGAFLGVYSHTFHAHGLGAAWWAWILPHGVTELLAVVLLAGGGLWIGRLLLSPGERGRLEALHAERGHIVRLCALAFPMLLLAALLESFVRQSELSDRARYAVAISTAVLWIVVFRLRASAERALARAAAARTLVERVIALPGDDELIGHRPSAARDSG